MSNSKAGDNDLADDRVQDDRGLDDNGGPPSETDGRQSGDQGEHPQPGSASGTGAGISSFFAGRLARWLGKSRPLGPSPHQNEDGQIWVLPIEDVFGLAPLSTEMAPNGILVSLPESPALGHLETLITRAGLNVVRQPYPEPIDGQKLAVVVALPGSMAARTLPELEIGAIWRRFAAQYTSSKSTGPMVVPIGLFSMRNWKLVAESGAEFAVPLSSVSLRLGSRLTPRTLAAEALTAIEQAKDAAAAASPLSAANDPFRMRAYRFGMSGLSFLAEPYLAWRARKGKEDPDRKDERFGRAGVARERGRYGWIHAASVGESVSILPLIRKLLDYENVDQLVVTTGTMTSAAVMEARLPARAVHQYVPLDTKSYVETFIDNWRPEFAIFVESEIWPNMYTALEDRDIPTAIVNGRMSEKSFKKWLKLPDLIGPILSSVDLCIAQSDIYASRFSRLGAPNVANLGNVKFDNNPLPVIDGDLQRLKELTKNRPMWLAASTHPGEEEAIAEVHVSMREKYPDLLTILVPRHPERGVEVATLLEDLWLSTARRSTGAEPRAAIDVYVADTIGELGLFYSLCPFAFLGGSLTEIGGHNPAEAARLDCAILHGPNIENFRDMYKIFGDAGAAIRSEDGAALFVEVEKLTANPSLADEMVLAGKQVLTQNYGSLDRVVQALMPLIENSPLVTKPSGQRNINA